MKVKGIVLNNSGKTKHIFQRSVYPGQSVDLEEAYSLLGHKVSSEGSFLEWLKSYIPKGWEIHGEEYSEDEIKAEGKGSDYIPEPKSEDIEDDDGSPSKRYLTPKKINELSSRDIANLRIKDEPRKIVNQIDSIHKLRRALTICNKMNGKASLSKIIKHRIDKLR